MSKDAQLNQDDAKRWISAVIFLCLILLAALLRYLMLPYTNYDMDAFSIWYDFIVQNGILHAQGQNFSSYTPPYLYLLSLATLTKDFIPKIVAIKLIPISFDLINALIIFKILRLKYTTAKIPRLAATLFLLAPTVMMNSALWGQIDALYTCFLLLSIYFVLKRQTVPSMIAFGVAVAIKAQAAFFAPFLLIMGFKNRTPLYSYVLIPLTYFAVMLPAIIAGRPIFQVFTVYLGQAGVFQSPSRNAPNWYFFVPESTYSISTPIGLVVAILAVGTWIYVYTRRKFPLTNEILLLTALVSVALLPFLLPKMHDRYFYPADVLSLVLAFFNPQFWFIALSYQALSSLAYSIFLFHQPRAIPLILAAGLNTASIIYLLWKQYQLTKNSFDEVKSR